MKFPPCACISCLLHVDLFHIFCTAASSPWRDKFSCLPILASGCSCLLRWICNSCSLLMICIEQSETDPGDWKTVGLVFNRCRPTREWVSNPLTTCHSHQVPWELTNLTGFGPGIMGAICKMGCQVWSSPCKLLPVCKVVRRKVEMLIENLILMLQNWLGISLGIKIISMVLPLHFSNV